MSYVDNIGGNYTSRPKSYGSSPVGESVAGTLYAINETRRRAYESRADTDKERVLDPVYKGSQTRDRTSSERGDRWRHPSYRKGLEHINYGEAKRLTPEEVNINFGTKASVSNLGKGYFGGVKYSGSSSTYDARGRRAFSPAGFVGRRVNIAA